MIRLFGYGGRGVVRERRGNVVVVVVDVGVMEWWKSGVDCEVCVDD